MLDFNEIDLRRQPRQRPSTRDAVRADLSSRAWSRCCPCSRLAKAPGQVPLIGDALGSPGDSLEVVLDGEGWAVD